MPNKQEQKFLINLVEEASMERKQNSFRYYVAINLFDQFGSGWIDKTTFVPFVADLFQVTQKTVKNNLNKLHTLNWGKNDPDKFFYYSQEKVLSLMHPESSSSKAVWISVNDLLGDSVSFRAFMYECTLAGRSKFGSITIARNTLHDKLNGHSRETQRKYEEIRGLTPIFNFGQLDGDDRLELTYKYNQPVFPISNGKGKDNVFFVRQLPNTYSSEIRVGKRNRRKHSDSHIQSPNVYDKRYYHSGDKAKSKKDGGFVETNGSVCGGVLWKLHSS